MMASDPFRGCLMGLATGERLGRSQAFSAGELHPLRSESVPGPAERLTSRHLAAVLRTAEPLMAGRAGSSPAGDVRAGDAMPTPSPGETVCIACQHSDDEHLDFLRTAVLTVFCYPDEAAACRAAVALAQAADRSSEWTDACRWLAGLLSRAIAGQSKKRVLFEDDMAPLAAAVSALARGVYRRLPAAEIAQPTGVDAMASLRAAVWCFERTDDFEPAMRLALTTGADVFTLALCGQLAGAYYGERAIPEHWRAALTGWTNMGAVADALRARSRRPLFV